jgi:hypothetical protein
MSLAAISLSALVAALVISCFSDINIGVLADLFANLLARLATPATSTAVTAFFTGLISILL